MKNSVDHNTTLNVINLGSYSTGIKWMQSPGRTFGKVAQKADVVQTSNTQLHLAAVVWSNPFQWAETFSQFISQIERDRTVA